ncbi:MAG: hypothetical protein LUG50_05865 [Planctomycetaceae bacterium]|nr:hypothetical protein [Planctomycetaceae bacterium]
MRSQAPRKTESPAGASRAASQASRSSAPSGTKRQSRTSRRVVTPTMSMTYGLVTARTAAAAARTACGTSWRGCSLARDAAPGPRRFPRKTKPNAFT